MLACKSLCMVWLVIMMWACAKPKNTYELNERVRISYRNRAIFRLPDTTLFLKYSDFKEESRCPPKSTCLWEGVVKVGVSHSGQSHCLGLGDAAALREDSILAFTDYGKYRIQLMEVGYTEEQFFGIAERSFVGVEVVVQ